MCVLCVCACVCVCVCVCALAHVYKCVYVHVYKRVYVHVLVWCSCFSVSTHLCISQACTKRMLLCNSQACTKRMLLCISQACTKESFYAFHRHAPKERFYAIHRHAPKESHILAFCGLACLLMQRRLLAFTHIHIHLYTRTYKKYVHTQTWLATFQSRWQCTASTSSARLENVH